MFEKVVTMNRLFDLHRNKQVLQIADVGRNFHIIKHCKSSYEYSCCCHCCCFVFSSLFGLNQKGLQDHEQNPKDYNMKKKSSCFFSLFFPGGSGSRTSFQSKAFWPYSFVLLWAQLYLFFNQGHM